MRAGQSSETPFTLQQWFPRTSISQTPRLVWWEIQEIQGLLEEKHQKHKANLRNTSSESSKTAYSNICKSVQTRLRDICKTPGWAKRLMKSSPLQTEKIWRRYLMHSRQYMVPRAQELPHSLVQIELVFWLTKKLSWKDGLNTLMVSLIGHHLSTMTLSTDYHRVNVIRCLMSSQPSLKQWKQ